MIVSLFSYNASETINTPLPIIGENSVNMWFLLAMALSPFINDFIHLDSILYSLKLPIAILVFALLLFLTLAVPFSIFDLFIRNALFHEKRKTRYIFCVDWQEQKNDTIPNTTK